MKSTRLIPLHTGAIGIRAGLACECQSVDGPEPLMDFIASDGRVDRYNEVIDQRGWQLENFRANPVIPDCHDYSSIARILGHAVNVEVKNGRLHNRVRFCTDNPLGNLAWKMTRAGFVRSQSVGFIPLEWRNGSGPEEPDRIYTKAELLEISLVVVPANPGATIGLAYKSGALDRSDLQSASDFLRTLSNQNLGTRDQSIHLLDLARTLRTAFEPLSPSPRSSRREETHSVSAQRSQLAPSKHRDPRSLSPGSSRREETHSISQQRSELESVAQPNPRPHSLGRSRREEAHSADCGSVTRSNVPNQSARESFPSSRREETHSISQQRFNAEPKNVSPDPLNSEPLTLDPDLTPDS